MKLAIITPTKDRPQDIRKMLHSFMAQTRRPDQVIVVDASGEPVSAVVDEFPALKIEYKRWTDKPSAAGQRNGGEALLRDDIDLVCFFDDDQVLHRDAVEKMMAFWANQSTMTQGGENLDVAPLTSTAPPLGAATFYNTDNEHDDRPSAFKKSWLSQKLGLYTSRPGGVAPSGWQNLYGPMTENANVEWMGSGAAVVRRDVLAEFPFDDFFDGYSYLEDLEFSYSISRKYRMTVVTEAKFDHFHSSAGRGSAVHFGRIEVRNRLYIVKKHGLSMASFRLAMCIRFCMSIASGQFERAKGNIDAFF
ncbi:glycosyltransferase [Desulfobulbus rhabdoformis]|uniref:glycosyltransferase family 2 protein n=1 Tax=Desulfobulbus rhabdoformis TaxID=34032 RepID=UPI0019624638|nr:glycosyltransferase family 2 protein [Desulfobulbus rhabdoformis]MBM9612696.1 glycosyltransferase [Desulfobulbus rhabdoformis]